MLTLFLAKASLYIVAIDNDYCDWRDNMNKVEECRKMAEETCKRIEERKYKNEEASRRGNLLKNLQYKYILLKIRRGFSKGKFSRIYKKALKYNYEFSDLLTRYTSLYVIERLEADGFEVVCNRIKRTKWYYLRAVLINYN